MGTQQKFRIIPVNVHCPNINYIFEIYISNRKRQKMLWLKLCLPSRLLDWPWMTLTSQMSLKLGQYLQSSVDISKNEECHDINVLIENYL